MYAAWRALRHTPFRPLAASKRRATDLHVRSTFARADANRRSSDAAWQSRDWTKSEQIVQVARDQSVGTFPFDVYFSVVIPWSLGSQKT